MFRKLGAGLTLALTSFSVRAQGLAEFDTAANNVVLTLTTASIAVVTIALLVAGYMMLFRAASLAIVAYIIGAGLLIGAAPAIAVWVTSF